MDLGQESQIMDAIYLVLFGHNFYPTAMLGFMTQTTVATLQTYEGNLCRVIIKIIAYVLEQKKVSKSCDDP